MQRLLLLLGALCFASCDGCRPVGNIPHCPPCPCLDMREPPRDLSVPPDLSSPADMAAPADMACVPRLGSCLAPAKCCPGLDCVGGLCAAVRTDL